MSDENAVIYFTESYSISNPLFLFLLILRGRNKWNYASIKNSQPWEVKWNVHRLATNDNLASST